MKSQLVLIGLFCSIAVAAEKPAVRKVAALAKCSEYFVVELKVHDNGISHNVPGGAFVHDSVYIGVSVDAKEASVNAVNSCVKGKYSSEDCQAATSTTYSGNGSKYSAAVGSIIKCAD